jgi:hypothetical protein
MRALPRLGRHNDLVGLMVVVPTSAQASAAARARRRARPRERTAPGDSTPARQHANLGIASVYLQGIDSAEIIDTVHSGPAPVISATSGLRATR